MMKKIYLIHPYSCTKADGVTHHCEELYSLFKDDDEFEVLPVDNLPIIKCRLFNGAFRFRHLYNAIKNSGADIVHVHQFTTIQVPQAMIAAWLCGKKIIYSPHWHPFSALNRPFLAKLMFYVLIYPFLKYIVKKCVAINDEDSAFLARFNRNVTCVPHWINDEMICKDTMAKRIHPSKEKLRILYVGRFDATNKGIDYLFYLPLNDYEIHLVGSGNIQPRNDMIIHENVSSKDLLYIYGSVDLVVVPSQYEAFSYVALEALSNGIPVLLSDRVRIADYLGGISGVTLFKYGDYESFCRSIITASEEMVDQNAIRAIFSKEQALKSYKDIYNI